GSSDGFAGTSNLTQQFTNIDNVIGGNASNTLTGLNASAIWEIDGTNRYISTNSLSFTGFRNLTGGSNTDTFIITGNQTADLRGQAGADRFQFNNAANLTGTIDGGTDSNTIDASAYTTAQQVTLTGLGGSDGFAGTHSSIIGGFTNISAIAGGTGTDTLIGLNASATWEVDGTNRYLSTNILEWNSFENLTGGNQADLFQLSVNPTGLITGGTGEDTLDFSNFPTAINLTLNGANITGFNGTGTVSFAGIDTIVGSANTRDTLTANPTAFSESEWNLDADPTFSDRTHTLKFSRIEDLTGKNNIRLSGATVTSTIDQDLTLRYNANTTTIELFNNLTSTVIDSTVITPSVDNLIKVIGTAGADKLTIDASVANAGLAVVFDALAGVDELNLSGFTTPKRTVLEKNDTNGFSGIGPVAFLGVDKLTGSNVTGDTLEDKTGALISSWQINNISTYDDGTHTLDFTGFTNLVGGIGIDTFNIIGTQTANLIGGAGADVFRFANNATLTGAIDGGTGADTLTYAEYTSPRQVTLTSIGSQDGFTGTEATISVNFTNINTLSGGSGNDTLTGINAAANWEIDGTNVYLSTNSLSFSGWENLIGGNNVDTFVISGTQTVNLTGGAGADTFQFNQSASLIGAIDGGTGADTLNYAAYTTARQITLTNLGSSDGFIGTETTISNNFTNIDVVVGSSGNDTLTGINAAANWEIDGTNRYISTNSLDISGVENLTGGSNADTFTISGAQTANIIGGAGADTFQFNDTATLTGTIDGGTGADTLDYAAYTTARQIALTDLGIRDGFSGTDAAISNGFNNIDTIVGSSTTDTITGINAAANWEIDGTNRYLSTNILNFSGIENLVGGSDADTFTISGAQTANIIGGAGADTFQFNDTATLTGTIDGGTGADTLDYAAYTTARQIALT
ncbi:beta strand repeat-containing protein, partial [Trichormus variabilis]